ncbi:toxin-antitoxin system HicB family antitoxin [Actinokineospora auranticolor]|uniref:HicB-like protein involved in pilus formation n=1 Tax=Actinokineospora auranticolor TaxID=155976 RepID=A0A2S6GQD0_9PSEU|nr:toxin-antitoxin system HicB family antitoxin [Actinokineospora auranticolor]PPK67472.1 HicB-like protein involved in pilus formation [Actinokineospora auranticolor]
MDLSSYLSTLRDDLTTTASAGDESTRRAAAVLSAAIEPAARLAIMNALADLAAEVTAHLPDHVVEVRLDGRDVRVVVTGTNTGPKVGEATPPTTPPAEGAGGDMSRMTLRLFEELKGKAERAAQAQGVSLNTFVQQTLQGALSGKNWGHRHDYKNAKADEDKNTSSRVQGWYEG